MQTETGMLVSLPLLRGGRHGALHAQIFNTIPVVMRDPMLFYLDFETDGLDVLRNSIVENAYCRVSVPTGSLPSRGRPRWLLGSQVSLSRHQQRRAGARAQVPRCVPSHGGVFR